MKHNKIKAIGLAVLSGMALASCDVEVLPLDTIISENYWTSKADVESVVYSCYSGICQSSVISRMIIWGEVRSDNIAEGSQISQAGDDIKYLLKGNILETNSFCDYSAFYTVINRCNTVELYAPIIQERDPNYTDSDLQQNIAEVRAIRALCYFYLLRTYGSVPFTFEASIDDSQNFYLPASTTEAILDSIIPNLEAYALYAPKRYVDEMENTARITRNGVYALLADLYLWKASNAKVDPAQCYADYLKCVEYCDLIIKAKDDEFKEDRYGNLKTQISRDVYGKYGYPLIEENAKSPVASADGVPAKAYNLIFGQGNSFEGLFELTFDSRKSSGDNGTIGSYYGGSQSDNGSYFSLNPNLVSSTIYTSGNKYDEAGDGADLYTPWDFRGQENFLYDDQNTQYINLRKYVIEDMNVLLGTTKDTWKPTGARVSRRGDKYSNWIIYRLTDVMLMKAEAEVQIAKYLDANPIVTPAKTRATLAYGNTFTTGAEYRDDVFNIICAIVERACPQATGDFLPKKNEVQNWDNFVETERRRELLLEGKRYYDLVRRARREGNTAYSSSKLSSKFTSNAAAMKIKMAMLEFLYMPYSEDELKRNKLLVQNPAFDKEKKNEIAK